MSEHSARPKHSRTWQTLGVLGELLITIGVVLALFIVWELQWTTWQVEGGRDQRVEAFQTENAPVDDGIADPRHDTPPVDQPQAGTLGVLHVPIWNWMKIPVQEGTTSAVLDTGDAGHYDGTALPGETGNFSVAGHRRTYGNNFRRIDKLLPGVKVVMETKNYYYVYEAQDWQIREATDPKITDVIQPNPDNPGQAPVERYMTMTTCNPEFGNWQRYIVKLKLDYWVPKTDGIPAELKDEPTN